MLNRFGNRILVGWSQKELVWLHAATTLPNGERESAYCDIAYMTGRSMAAVRKQAYLIECARQDAYLKTSKLRAPTPQEKMAQRAYPIRMALPRTIAKAGTSPSPIPPARAGHINPDRRVSPRFQTPIEN